MNIFKIINSFFCWNNTTVNKETVQSHSEQEQEPQLEPLLSEHYNELSKVDNHGDPTKILNKNKEFTILTMITRFLIIVKDPDQKHIVDSLTEPYDCPLCLNTFEPEHYKHNIVMLYGCNHMYCIDCIDIITKKDNKDIMITCSLCYDKYYVEGRQYYREHDIYAITLNHANDLDEAKKILRNHKYNVMNAIQ
jgi:hypothetical protein